MKAEERRKGQSAAVFAVVLIYAFFAGLWILLSDRAIRLMFSDPDMLVGASMVKGWFFVAVTSLLLHFLVRRLVGQLSAAHLRELEHQRLQKQPPPMLVAIAESSEDAIFAKDEAGCYLLFNNAAAQYVGKLPAEVVGHDDAFLFPAEQAAMLKAIDRRIIASGKVETNEEVLQTANGTRVFLATKGPLRDVAGKIFGTFGIARDISVRKLAEEELKRRNEELERFNHAATDRELRMIELKRQINGLAKELGRPPPYDLSFTEILSGGVR